MSKTMKLVRFTNWERLKNLSRELLMKLVSPFVGQITEHGIELPKDDLEDKDYYTGWTGVFAHPDSLPVELTETLITIDEMSQDAAHDNLMDQVEAEELTFDFGEKPTAMEVAVKIHLEQPDFLRAKHAEERLRKLRSFVHLLPALGAVPPPYAKPTAEQLDELAERLRPFFKKKIKGEYVSVDCHKMDGEFWFIIVHGETVQRTMEVKDDAKTSVLRYRPETDDVLVYNPGSNSIRINAGTVGARKEYATHFGQMFFGNGEYFKLSEKFCFGPIHAGRDAFDDVEIEGIQEVVLREIRVMRGWGQHAVMTLRADDLFQVMEEGHFKVYPDTRVFKVAMDVVFAGDEKQPRSVKIVDENTASMARACDHALVEKWLDEVGFIRDRGDKEPEETGAEEADD
jgi:hypothetical protein